MYIENFKDLFVEILLSAIVDYMSYSDNSKERESSIRFFGSSLCEIGLGALKMPFDGNDIIGFIESGVVDLENLKSKMVGYEATR